MGNSRNKSNTLSLFLYEVKGGVVFFFLFLLSVVHPFYVPEKFYYIGTYKLLFFERVTLVFLAASVFFFILTIIFLPRSIKIKFETTDVAFLALAGWNIVSLFLSPYFPDGLLGYETWRMGLLTQLAITAIYFIIKQWANKWKSIITITMIAFTFENILVILQRFGKNPLNLYAGMGLGDWNRRNLLGTIGNSNWLCGYMMCLVPVLIWLYLLEEKRVWNVIWGIMLFISLAALFLQGSSSGVVALAGVLLVCLCFVIKTYKNLIRLLSIPFMISFFWMMLSLFQVELLEPEEVHTPQKVYSLLWIIPVIILLAVIVILSAWVKKKHKDDLSFSFIRNTIILIAAIIFVGMLVFTVIQIWGPSSDNGIVQKLIIKDTWGSNRVLLWKETLKHFFGNTPLKSILFGVGPDCYGNWFIEQEIYIPAEGPLSEVVYTNAHNLILTMLVNAGLIGMLIYLATWGSLLFLFIKKRKESYFSLLGILMITGMGINGFFSFQQVCATPLFYALLGLVRGMTDRKESVQDK
ncbi:MAG: O-antigen ligase family protein [Lachnospiraceae bacterium]|nr:O-antigen ligase family protein [Lachnospiraceae bacterium]